MTTARQVALAKKLRARARSNLERLQIEAKVALRDEQDRIRREAWNDAIRILEDQANGTRILDSGIVGWIPRNTIAGAARLLRHYMPEETQ